MIYLLLIFCPGWICNSSLVGMKVTRSVEWKASLLIGFVT